MLDKLEILLKEYQRTLKTSLKSCYTDNDNFNDGHALGQIDMLVEVIMDLETIISVTKKEV